MHANSLLDDTLQTDTKCDKDLQAIFAACFFEKYHTVLIGEALEPLYMPAQAPTNRNTIFYRNDYFSSALHEVAHWCIAGKSRRQKVDYGYWYSPDGRDAKQQQAFEMVEAKPQALEWAFSIACRIDFRVSIDNLQATESIAPSILIEQQEIFSNEVKNQLKQYLVDGFPSRAQVFLNRLHEFYSTSILVPSDVY